MELIAQVRKTITGAQKYPADSISGGKAKPLKAPKKAPKAELDDEDKAFMEKQRAGMSILVFSSNIAPANISLQTQRPRLSSPRRLAPPRDHSTPVPRESRSPERSKASLIPDGEIMSCYDFDGSWKRRAAAL